MRLRGSSLLRRWPSRSAGSRTGAVVLEWPGSIGDHVRRVVLKVCMHSSATPNDWTELHCTYTSSTERGSANLPNPSNHHRPQGRTERASRSATRADTRSDRLSPRWYRSARPYTVLSLSCSALPHEAPQKGHACAIHAQWPCFKMFPPAGNRDKPKIGSPSVHTIRICDPPLFYSYKAEITTR